MRAGVLIDPIADRLLELRRIAPVQWGLRGGGTLAVAGALALVLISPSTSGASVGIVLAVLVSAIGLVALWFDPDTDLGVLALLPVVAALFLRGDLTMALAGATGLLLLLGHAAFAIAAVMPVHGTLERAALRLAVRALAGVVVLAVVAGLLVMLLARIQLGPWMIVLGAVAAVALWIAVVPRAPGRR